jgi:hypothetical protein
MPSLALAILAFLWIALTGCLLGGGLLRRLAPAGPGGGQRALLAWGLGLPLLAYATLALGLLGRVSRLDLAAMLVVAGAVGLALGWRELGLQGRLLRRAGRALAHSPQRLWYWLLALWALTLVPQALAPPGFMDWDGLAEHLAMAKVWLQQGAIVPLWYDHHSQFPATVQMLYLLGLAFGGPVAAKLFSYLFGLLSLAAVGMLARRHFGRESGAWALAVFAATPLVGWLSIVAYVDLPAVFYCVLGLSFFLDWTRERRTPAAAWSGVCLGLGLAVKMQVLVFWGALLLVGLVGALRRASARTDQAPPVRRPSGPPDSHGPSPQGRSTGPVGAEGVGASVRVVAGQLLAYAGLALAVASPWYVKSWIITGNPVYPFAYRVFGGKQWSAEQARTYAYQQKSWGWGALPAPEVFWSLPPLQRAFTGPRRPDHLLLAPLGLIFRPEKYVDAGFGRLPSFLFASVGPLYLALLPLLLWGKRPWAWGLVAWALVPVWLWWLISAQYSRYFLPGLGWLAPAAAWAADQAVRRGRWSRRVLPGVMGAGLGLAILFNLLGAATGLPVVVGAQSVDSYLRTVQPGLYPALEFLNRTTPPDARIISYGEPRLFYLDRPYLWGEPNYHRLLDYDRMKTADDLLAAYRNLGVSHVLVNAQFFPGGVAVNEKIAALLQEALAAGKLEGLAGPPGMGPYQVLAARATRGPQG